MILAGEGMAGKRFGRWAKAAAEGGEVVGACGSEIALAAQKRFGVDKPEPIATGLDWRRRFAARYRSRQRQLSHIQQTRDESAGSGRRGMKWNGREEKARRRPLL